MLHCGQFWYNVAVMFLECVQGSVRVLPIGDWRGVAAQASTSVAFEMYRLTCKMQSSLQISCLVTLGHHGSIAQLTLGTSAFDFSVWFSHLPKWTLCKSSLCSLVFLSSFWVMYCLHISISSPNIHHSYYSFIYPNIYSSDHPPMYSLIHPPTHAVFILVRH